MLYEGVRSLHHQFGMKYRYLIPNTLYGPQFDPQDSHFIFDLIKKIVAGKTKGDQVSLWGDGQQIRELIYITDAIKLIELATNRDQSDTINLSCGVGYSIKEYAKMICDIVGYNSSLIRYDTTKFSGIPKKVLNPEKLQRLFDFKFTPICEGLKHTIDYYTNI
jgi:GDP-L-fucose synthase